MNKDLEKLYKELPVIDIKNKAFSSLNDDKSKNRIIDLINQDIIFELKDPVMKTIQHSYGKLLSYDNSYLSIRPYDYDYIEDFKDNIQINISDIKGIEKYNKCDNILNNKYINKICKIIDRDNNDIIVLILNFNEFEVDFQFKYQGTNEEFIGAGSYPICLIKEIEII